VLEPLSPTLTHRRDLNDIPNAPGHPRSMPKAKAMKKKTYGAKPKATKKVKAPAPAKKAPPPKKARARVVTSAREPRATDALP
jgi:hypothetical protein